MKTRVNYVTEISWRMHKWKESKSLLSSYKVNILPLGHVDTLSIVASMPTTKCGTLEDGHYLLNVVWTVFLCKVWFFMAKILDRGLVQKR